MTLRRKEEPRRTTHSSSRASAGVGSFAEMYTLLALLRSQRKAFLIVRRWQQWTKPLLRPSRFLPLPVLEGAAHQSDLLVCREEEDAGAALLHVSGEVDLFTAPLLRQNLARLVDGGRDAIVVLLEEVQYIDMAGIRALEQAFRRAQESGARLVCASPSPIVRRVFEIVGMQRQLPVLPNKAAALRHLAGDGYPGSRGEVDG